MIQMCKQYRTRDGRKVRILCVDRKAAINQEPVIGLIDHGKYEELTTWNEHGEYSPTVRQLGLVEISTYEDWPIDAPVWVRDNDESSWEPRHFAGVSDGLPAAWMSGATSFSAFGKVKWKQARLAAEFTPTAEGRGE